MSNSFKLTLVDKLVLRVLLWRIQSGINRLVKLQVKGGMKMKLVVSVKGVDLGLTIGKPGEEEVKAHVKVTESSHMEDLSTEELDKVLTAAGNAAERVLNKIYTPMFELVKEFGNKMVDDIVADKQHRREQQAQRKQAE